MLLLIWTIALLLLVATSLDLSIIWGQNAVTDQDSSANLTNQLLNRLDTMIENLEQAREGRIIQLYLTIIVFMMGLAFVVFGLYIGQEKRLSTFTRRLYLIAYFALIIPVTVILARYIINTLLSGALYDPVLTVAFLLLIPVAASYVLMLAKARHDILGRP